MLIEMKMSLENFLETNLSTIVNIVNILEIRRKFRVHIYLGKNQLYIKNIFLLEKRIYGKKN